MSKPKITQRERRFLIIWIGVCAFALLTNVTDLKGDIKNPGSRFTLNVWSSHTNEDDFWPFTEFTYKHTYAEPKPGVVDQGNGLRYGDLDIEEGTHFYGFFNSFNALEFFIYSLLGIAIIFIPKIW